MEQIITKLLNNFDFWYMLIINVLTYMIIQVISKYKELNVWKKRIILLSSVIVITTIYKIVGYDNNLTLINSAILAPVSWSWIFKPVVNYFKKKSNGRNN